MFIYKRIGGTTKVNHRLEDIKYKVMAGLHVSQLTKGFLSFGTLHFAYLTLANLVTVFANTLFFRLSGETGIVMEYNIIRSVVFPLFMMLAVVCARRYSAVVSLRVGLSAYIVTYLVFLALMDHLLAFMPLIALLVSVAEGFYWMAYSIIITDTTEDNTRDAALAYLGLGGAVVSLIMPTATGMVISFFPNSLMGYYVMFAISLGVTGLAMWQSRKIIPTPLSPGTRSFFTIAKKVFSSKMWICCELGQMFKGLRDGVFLFYLNLLLFEFIQSEMLVGVNTLLVGVASIFSFWLMGKVVHPHNRAKSLLLSASGLLLCVCGLFFNLSPASVMIVSGINAFFNGFLITTPTSNLFMMIGEFGDSEQSRPEYAALDGLLLNWARAVGILFVALMPSTTIARVSALAILVALQFVTGLFCHLNMKYFRAYKKKQMETAQ